MRYRLQRKESHVMPNILGGRSYPVHTYIWKDIAISNDAEALKNHVSAWDDKKYRIVDTKIELR